MATIDINAMRDIGRTMGGNARDNTTRDQAISVLGGLSLQLLGGALNTRKQLRSETNSTAANAQHEVDELGVVGTGEGALNAGYSTEVLNEQRKIIQKANNAISFGINTSKATAKKLKAENTIKNHVEGLKYVDKMMDTWKGIYKDGTVETADKDGNMIKRKVKVNAASSATSQALGASFANGSISGSLDFRDGKWGVVSESVVPGTEGEEATSAQTFTTLENIQLPELDESSALYDHKKGYLDKYYKLGGTSKNAFNSQDKVTLKKDLYNDYSQMSYNQISSTWFAGSGSDKDTPAHKYVTQAGGYTFSNGETVEIPDPFKLTNDNGVAFSEEEKAQRLQTYTAAFEDLKMQDLDNGDKMDWFIDNYAMQEVEAEFNKGFGDRQTKGGKGGKGGDLGRYLNINNTYSNDAVVRGYMDDITNGETVLFKDGNGESKEYTPNQDGTYTSPKGRIISKDRVAKIMGLPKYNYGSVEVAGGGDGDGGFDYDKDFGFDFIKMNEEDAETYLEDKLPEGFTYDQYGPGDAIEIKYGDESVDINLQPNTSSGEKNNIEKIQDFIKKHISGKSLEMSEEPDTSQTNPYG
tara:strand:+ start:862 stop:2607 length:1746 start_codon:yes stop_codon:yes gene_type:complete